MFSPLIILFWFCIGLICAKVAKTKNRNEYIWFLLGVLFSLFALSFIYFLQPIKKETKKIKINTQLSLIKLDPNYWYYLDKNKNQIGPMSLKALFDNYKLKKISEFTLVWNDTMENWQKLNETSIFSKFFKDLPTSFKNPRN